MTAHPDPDAARPGAGGGEIPPGDPRLSHVDAAGAARMVDVSGKAPTVRFARASGAIRMLPETLNAIRHNMLQKGDVVATARLAGIMAAKRTADLIPLCHPLPLSAVEVSVTLDEALPGIRVVGSARTTAPTGVEMEALTAVSVALLTVYDMAKAVDRSMQVTDIVLREKRGGAGGDYLAD